MVQTYAIYSQRCPEHTAQSPKCLLDGDCAIYSQSNVQTISLGHSLGQCIFSPIPARSRLSDNVPWTASERASLSVACQSYPFALPGITTRCFSCLMCPMFDVFPSKKPFMNWKCWGNHLIKGYQRHNSCATYAYSAHRV